MADEEVVIDTGERCVVSPWGKFKIDLCKSLVKDEVKQAIVLVRDEISESRRKKLSAPIDLLEALENEGVISEDRTDPLKEILTTIGNVAAVEELHRYRQLRDQYKKSVKLLAAKHDPLFVGRDEYMRKIIDVFGRSATFASCVCLFGLAGTGKTKLAVQTSAIYKELQRPKPRLIMVDLRKRSNVIDVGVALLTSVGRQVSAKDFNLTMINDWMRSCTQQENVLLMDNADELLQPSSLSRDHFINMMAELMSIQNPKVKFIITSRYAMRFDTLKDKSNFEEIEVRALEVRESIQLLVREYQMTSGEKEFAENTAEEIAHHCGNNPQALRAIATRLKMGTFTPKSLAAKLRKPQDISRLLDPGLLGSTTLEEEGEQDNIRQKLVLQSLKATVDMLPDRLQEGLVKLSILPGSFDRQKAKFILGMEDSVAVDVDIDELRQWSLVECEEFSGFENLLQDDDKQYTIHPLICTVCMLDGMKGKRHNAIYTNALDRLCEYVADLMQQLSTIGHKEYVRALGKFEEERPLVTHFMEMDMGETFSGFKLHSLLLETDDSTKQRARLSTLKNAESIYHLFECFLDVQKLEQYFRCKTNQMKDSNEMEAWALCSGWLADQLMVQAKYEKASESLKDPLGWLKSLPLPLSKDADLAKAQCLAIQGRYLSDKPRPDHNQAIKLIEESLDIRKNYLGDDSLTARCLNFLGHAHHRQRNNEKSKTYHEQAWEMLARITDGNPEKHFDAPTYALNIGTSYHQLGNYYMNWFRRQTAKEHYRHAISFFDKAQEMEKKLRLEGNPMTAVIMKNKAMSYCEMKEYESALPLAVKASELRKKGIGTHPDTARSLFFVGSLYHSLGEEEKKSTKLQARDIQNFQDALKYYKEALKMEMELGPEGKSWEYKHLQEDFEKLLKQLGDNKQLQRYRGFFKEAAKKSFVVPEEPRTDDDGASASAESPRSPQKRKATDHEDMPEPKRPRCLIL